MIYDNHIHYFYTRALEIETANFDDTNWNGDGITYYDMKDAAMSKEVKNDSDDSDFSFDDFFSEVYKLLD